MKLTLTKNDVKRIKVFDKVIEKRSTMPILSHVLVEVSDTGVRFSGTDLESFMRVTVGDSKPGKGITVPWTMLKPAIIPGELEIEIQGDKLKIGAQSLIGVSADEYPTLKPLDLIVGAFAEIPVQDLDGIDPVLDCMTDDETRFNLCGLCFEMRGSVCRAVATDGHRLGLLNLPNGSATHDYSVIIPRKSTKLLSYCDGGRLLIQEDRFVSYQTEGLNFAIRTIDGEFPDYRQVIPKPSKKRRFVEVQGDLLVRELTTAMGFVTDKAKGVRLTLNGSIEINGQSPERGSYTNEIPVIESDHDIALEIGFNGRYLSEMVRHFDRVRITTDGDLGATEIWNTDDPRFSGIIMPMRLSYIG